MKSPIKPYKIVKKSPPLKINEDLSNHKVNSSKLKQDYNPSPPKFGIKPNNPRIMFMRDELNSKEIFNEKLKQVQFKEYLEYFFKFICNIDRK